MIEWWLTVVLFCIATEVKACGTAFFGNGHVRTPNFPLPYPDNVFCVWRLTSLSGLALRLQFRSFSLEDEFDSLAVYLVQQNDSRKLTSYTGYELPRTLVTSGPELLLNFTSDFSVAYSGFDINFTSVNPETVNGSTLLSPQLQCVLDGGFFCNRSVSCVSQVLRCDGQANCAYGDDELQCGSRSQAPTAALAGGRAGCGAVLYTTGQISSPSYPLPYPDNANCIWHLTASEGRVVQLRIVSLWIESTLDQLQIYSGNSTTPENLVQMYTGFAARPETLFIARRAVLRFTSDESLGFAGFFALFSSADANTQTTSPTSQIMVNDVTNQDNSYDHMTTEDGCSTPTHEEITTATSNNFSWAADKVTTVNNDGIALATENGTAAGGKSTLFAIKEDAESVATRVINASTQATRSRVRHTTKKRETTLAATVIHTAADEQARDASLTTLLSTKFLEAALSSAATRVASHEPISSKSSTPASNVTEWSTPPVCQPATASTCAVSSIAARSPPSTSARITADLHRTRFASAAVTAALTPSSKPVTYSSSSMPRKTFVTTTPLAATTPTELSVLTDSGKFVTTMTAFVTITSESLKLSSTLNTQAISHVTFTRQKAPSDVASIVQGTTNRTFAAVNATPDTNIEHALTTNVSTKPSVVQKKGAKSKAVQVWTNGLPWTATIAALVAHCLSRSATRHRQ